MPGDQQYHHRALSDAHHPPRGEIDHLLERCWEQRRSLGLASPSSACRLIDSRADGFPGLTLDHFAGRWVLSTLDLPSPPAHLTRAAARHPACRALYWRRLEQGDKSPPSLLLGEPEPAPFLVDEGPARFELNPAAGYSPGLFLDQRDNRRRVAAALAPGHSLLNLFAYTASFSVVAALAGATTSTVDLSQGYLDWGRRNFSHNGIDPSTHHFVRGDALEWLKVFAKKGRAFDAAVVDPPTFSRHRQSPKGRAQTFRIPQDFPALLQHTIALIRPSGWLLCSTNCRSLSPADFQSILLDGLAASGRHASITPLPMPPDFPGEPYLKSSWLQLDPAPSH